jgi:protein-L-isoaspartate(D-aspartate) O-methyltransferase
MSEITSEQAGFNIEQARFNMIEQQVRPWEILDQRVLDVMTRTPREEFVPPRYRRLAFADVAIPLGHEQVMMIPKVEGRLLQALALQTSDHLLEVGTGSGYLTACLARLSASVVSVDLIPEFVQDAQRKLRAQRLDNVILHVGDAAQGWGEQRYNAIALTGSLPRVPERWRQQLSIGGRLFVIVGEPPIMEALLITRLGEQEWTQDSLFDTVVPPLLNASRPVAFEF